MPLLFRAKPIGLSSYLTAAYHKDYPIDLENYPFARAVALEVHENFVYILWVDEENGNSVLSVMDLTDPLDPTMISHTVFPHR